MQHTIPKLGELREVALWYSGDEQKARAKHILGVAFNEAEQAFGVVFGPISYHELEAGHQRLGDNAPPEAGAKCLIAEAEVIGLMPMPAADAGFIAGLAPADLERLRKATHRAYKKANPGSAPLRQDVLDRVIGRLAPETARRIVMAN